MHDELFPWERWERDRRRRGAGPIPEVGEEYITALSTVAESRGWTVRKAMAEAIEWGAVVLTAQRLAEQRGGSAYDALADVIRHALELMEAGGE